jgi:DNA-binding beta-propeller fold protein YncE
MLELRNHALRSVALLLVTCISTVLPVCAAQGAEASYAVRTLQLPRTAPGGVAMDYIAFDPATQSVWVPAGNTGTVVVIDAQTGATRLIDHQPTAEITRGPRKFEVGPSSVTIGDGSVYVGNRADSSICAFDPRSLARRTCHRLDSMPDGLAYVAKTREVWVTTPRDKSIRVLDAATLSEKARLTFEGNPEGFAVDNPRGRFYTNLEDKDRTLAIDLDSRKTVATWSPSCGEEGPHGLRTDAKQGWLFVACSARVEVLDSGHDGKVLSSSDTGDGVDDIDYAPEKKTLYAGAARAGQLSIFAVDARGVLSVIARVPTPKGARNPAVTDKGVVYLAHSARSGLSDMVVVEPKR